MYSAKLATRKWQQITSFPKFKANRNTLFSRNLASTEQEQREQPEHAQNTQSVGEAKLAEQKTSEALEVKTKPTPKKLTAAEADELLRQKMAGLAGDGGESGVEYEDGKPVAMKRSVKNNMFRLI